MAELSLRTVRALSAAARLRRRQPKGTPGGGQFRPEMSGGGYRPPPFVMKQLEKAKNEKSFRRIARNNGLDNKTTDRLWDERGVTTPPAPPPPVKKPTPAKKPAKKPAPAKKVATVTGTSRIIPPTDITIGPRQIKDLEKMREEERQAYYERRRKGFAHKTAVEDVKAGWRPVRTPTPPTPAPPRPLRTPAEKTPVTLRRATPGAFRKRQTIKLRWDFADDDATSKYKAEIAAWKSKLAPLMADNAVIDISVPNELDASTPREEIIKNYSIMVDTAVEFDQMFPGVMKEMFGFFIAPRTGIDAQGGLAGQVDIIHDDRNITSARSDGVYKHRTGLGLFLNGGMVGKGTFSASPTSFSVASQMADERDRIRSLVMHELGHVLHAAAYVRVRNTTYYDAYAAWHGSSKTNYYETAGFLQDKSFVDGDSLFDVMTGRNAKHAGRYKLPSVSQYAETNIGEQIAETFSAIMMRDEDVYEYDWSRVTRQVLRSQGWNVRAMDDVRIEAAELFFEELYYNAVPDRDGLVNWRRDHHPPTTSGPG